MRRRFLFFLAILLFPGACFGQSNPSDSETLQQLLGEVRALHQELHSSLAKVQKAQILIARLQAQETAVARVSQHLDELRSKLTEAQNRVQMASANVQRLQEAIGADDGQANQKEFEDAIQQYKLNLQTATNDQQSFQTEEIEAEQQLRVEQDKLDTLQAQLDKIVKSLDTEVASGPSPH